MRRLDFKLLLSEMNEEDRYQFLSYHLIAATKEVRPDIVRLLFQHIGEPQFLHRILLYCDKGHEDETFTKTALEWAVENNDR